MYVWIDLHTLIMNNFEHRVLRIESINTALQRCAIVVGVLKFHRRMLRIKGSGGHSRCTDLHAFLNNFEHRVFCA